MRTTAQIAGSAAEDLVVRHLRALGWIVLARNLRVGRAEIDVLAVDPEVPRTMVVVEVRWRGRRDFGLPEETVGRAKLTRLRAAALGLRDRDAPARPRVPALPVRVDIVAVEPARGIRHCTIRHYRHVG